MVKHRLTPMIVSRGIKPEWCSNEEWEEVYVHYLHNRRKRMKNDDVSKIVSNMKPKSKKKEPFTGSLSELSQIEGIIWNPLGQFTTKQLKKELKRRKKMGK